MGPSRPNRVRSVDRLRGLIIALMALDHGSSFWSTARRQSEYWAVGFPRYTDDLEFVVRLVSHLCAPGFFLLMGASMALSARGKSGDARRQLDGFLLRRGALLVGLQFSVINAAWYLGGAARPYVLHPGGGGSVWVYFGVLAALGACMVLLVPLMRLSTRALLLGGAALVGGCFVLLPDAAAAAALAPIWQRIGYVPGQTGMVLVRYPWLPWLGVSMWGVVLGRLLAEDADRAHRGSIVVGLVLLGGFVALRLLDAPLDPNPRQAGWVGVFNVTKYPPSPAFLMLTVGANLALLGLLSGAARRRDPLTTLGRAALFFYVVHLYLLGGVGHLLPRLSAPETVLAWLVALVPLWALSRWWGPFKASRPPGSPLRYL